MKVELVEAGFEDKPVLRRMMELYLYDFTEFDPRDLNDHGEFGYRYLDHYWAPDPGETRVPFLIRTEGKLVGFALVRRVGDGPWLMSEFFVLRMYRRSKVGSAAAQQVFARFPGPWEVHELGQNLPAQAFWRRVIGEFTGGKFGERSNDTGIAQMFISANSRP